MRNNQNSFAMNVAELTDNVNNAISTLTAISDSFIGYDSSVNFSLGDASVIIPSYNNVINRLNTVENTVKSFVSGQGSVKLLDGTNRMIKVTTLPSIPAKIENIDNVSNFYVDANWFFEQLLFPKIIVKFDLKDKISDDSDRIKIMRVILDISKDDNNSIINFYDNNIKNKKITYPELISLLSNNNISYYEDEEILDLPIYENRYVGNFNIERTEIINGELWYYLDNMYYGINNEYDQNVTNNIVLNVNDKLQYFESVYNIVSIDIPNKRIKIKSDIGFDVPGVGSILSIYNEPFNEKIINLPISINEINCVFFKGINDNYNILGDLWSDMVSFVTNDLKLYDDNTTTLLSYYVNNVADFGAEWLAEAKERKISAYNGKVPNVPTLVASDFRVEQINTQINAALNVNEIKNTQDNIVSLKSKIASLRSTISKLKMDLLETEVNDVDTKNNIQTQIKFNTNILNTSIAEYTSNVEYLNTYLIENKAAINTPKYRIRGFFAIPELQYSNEYIDDNSTLIQNLPQEIIGFDIRYRYLKLDENGVPLTTYQYTDINGNKINATFSDWNIITSKYKEKLYDKDLGIYRWKPENDADGNEININQIDIPISDGEKVEICVRSISEAGYPINPLKSEWSNSIIIEFPSNLSTTDQLLNILNDVKSEMTAIKLDETLTSAGYYNHIADEIVSNDNENIIYHHLSNNILYRDTNNNGESIVKSLYDKIKELEKRIEKLENKA